MNSQLFDMLGNKNPVAHIWNLNFKKNVLKIPRVMFFLISNCTHMQQGFYSP